MELELDDRIPGNMADLSYNQLKELYKLQIDKEKALLRIELVKALAPVVYDKNKTIKYNANNIVQQVDDIIYHLNI